MELTLDRLNSVPTINTNTQRMDSTLSITDLYISVPSKHRMKTRKQVFYT